MDNQPTLHQSIYFPKRKPPAWDWVILPTIHSDQYIMSRRSYLHNSRLPPTLTIYITVVCSLSYTHYNGYAAYIVDI